MKLPDRYRAQQRSQTQSRRRDSPCEGIGGIEDRRSRRGRRPRGRAPSRTRTGPRPRRRSRPPSEPHTPRPGSGAARSPPAPWSGSTSRRCRRGWRHARATRSATGSANSQPMENDSARLTQDQNRMVLVRLQRVEGIAPAIDASAMLATTSVSAAEEKCIFRRST